MKILTLEASTSSAKAMVYSSEEGVLSTKSIPYDLNTSNGLKQDPKGVFQTVIRCGQELLKNQNYSIEIISLSSVWHSLLLLDKERLPATKIMTWADTESSPVAMKYRKDKKFKEKLYKKTGCVINSIYPLWKYIHLKEKNVINSETYISSLPEYIFEKLTGEIGISKSVASGTGFMNIHTLDWDDEILNFAGISRNQMSPLKELEFNAPLKAEIAQHLGVKPGIPVMITGPDGAFNQVGAGAMKQKHMTLSVGTSAAMRIISDEPILPNNPSTWCYYVTDKKRLAGAAISGAGNCLNWFKQQLLDNKMDYPDLESFISIEKIKEAPIFLPFLYGERCPGWQDNRLGGFFQLNGTSDIGQLYYSILEGIVFNLYQCYKIFKKMEHIPEKILVSGGIVNSDFWLQMLSDVFQTELCISEVEHASMMGSAVLALEALGKISTLSEFKYRVTKKIKPNKNKSDFYRYRYAKYLEWYHKTDKESECNEKYYNKVQ